ncbi:MAG: translation initiation factor IF-3 [Clostridia bacterium]|nr:translation initiation factor IF-3 [Clostridia bacterium]
MAVKQQETQINSAIRDPEVRVIGANGDQLGIMSSREANELADKEGLDLVKISPSAVPPVCRIMDYGKYLFDKTKREKEQRKNQKIVELKEVQLSMTIEQHDIDIKAKNAVKFLNNGDKVKVSIRMSGRQQAYFERGIETENKFAESLQEIAVIEKPAKVEGRNIIMILAPKNAKK